MVLRRTPRHVAMAGAILVTKKAPPLITSLYPSPQYTPLLLAPTQYRPWVRACLNLIRQVGCVVCH
jgi:hypothetical protein